MNRMRSNAYYRMNMDEIGYCRVSKHGSYKTYRKGIMCVQQ